MSIPEVVREIITRNRSVYDCMKMDLINYTALAVKIQPEIEKIESFIVPPGIGINYKPGTWHFPLISTENMNFLVIDRQGPGNNLVIESLEKEKITLEF